MKMRLLLSLLALWASVAGAAGEVANLSDFELADMADRCVRARLRIMSANLKGAARLLENSSIVASLSRQKAADMVDALASGQVGVADEVGRNAYSICIFVGREMQRRTR